MMEGNFTLEENVVSAAATALNEISHKVREAHADIEQKKKDWEKSRGILRSLQKERDKLKDNLLQDVEGLDMPDIEEALHELPF